MEKAGSEKTDRAVGEHATGLVTGGVGFRLTFWQSIFNAVYASLNMYRLHRRFEDIIVHICRAHGISCQPLSDHWVFELSKGTARWLVYGYDIGLNSSATHHICRDKTATYAVLHKHNVPAIEHKLFMSYEDMLPYFKEYKDIVLKRNDGGGGNDVFHITDIVSLRKYAHALFSCSRAIALSPFHVIEHEYRVVILNGEALFMFSKHPSEGEWRHNLAHGAQPRLVQSEAVASLAKSAATAVKLRFGMVDIVSIQSTTSKSKSNLKVLEINSSAMLEHVIRHGFEAEAHAIYEQALLSLVSCQSR